jgi:CAAX prenyl protease-like protein
MSLAPWILLFVVSNAFMEELLFRGLFLGRYEPLIGKWLAVLSTALAFTLAHMQVTYAPKLWGFLRVTLGFSIAWGWLMQKTASLWGSVLFHAGADLLIVVLPRDDGFGKRVPSEAWHVKYAPGPVHGGESGRIHRLFTVPSHDCNDIRLAYARQRINGFTQVNSSDP